MITKKFSYKLKKIILKGKIIAGQGEGAKFINLSWVREKIQESLQFNPFAGTLNLLLSKESMKNKYLLKQTQNIRIDPAKGFYEGTIIPAMIKNQQCAIVIPHVKNYPKDVIEIIAPVNLRDNFKFKDGDEVLVYFFI